MLATKYRPKSFDDFVGQEKLIKEILGHLKHGKMPSKNWYFIGDRGSGKTSLARVMALSYQCRHDKFGYPCKKCRKKYSSFNIREINASAVRQVEDVEKVVEGANAYPSHGSRKRVYILDEAQLLSKHSQNFLLKYIEEKPKTTLWFICTTEDKKIISTLKRRLLVYGTIPLKEEGIRELVKRIAKKERAEISPVKLSEALWENDVTSSGLILNAIEKKIAGASYEDAANVEQTNAFNSKALIRSLIKGDWNGARVELKNATTEDARTIRAGVSAYLKSILLDSDDLSDRTEAVARAIDKIALAHGEDSTILAVISSACFEVARKFQRHSR